MPSRSHRSEQQEEEEEEMEHLLLLHAAASGNLHLVKGVAESLNKEGNGMAETIKGIRCSDGLCALHYAAASGRTEICQYLIEELGIPVDFPSASSPSSPLGKLAGGTPLHYAAREGQSGTVTYLIEQGANPTATDKECSTPLFGAATFGHAEVVKLLLSRGVPVDPEHHRGTPLHVAASHGGENVMKILIEHGADINKLHYDTLTPLLYTLMVGSLKCTKLLIKAGADVNLRCPLRTAIHLNKPETLKCLLDAGADPSIPSDDGRYSIELAAVLGRKEMVDILFPLTSPIPQVKHWSLEGLYRHIFSAAFLDKVKLGSQKKLADLKMKGEDSFKRRNYLTAACFYDLAIEMDSTDAAFFANRSICWLKAGYGERALEDAYLARSLRPDWPKAYYRVGAALMLLEEYEQASKAFQDGLKFDPTNEEIKKALRDALDCMKKSKQ